MNAGDLAIKRFGFKRVYEIVSPPIKGRIFTYYEVRKRDQLTLVNSLRLKKITI